LGSKGGAFASESKNPRNPKSILKQINPKILKSLDKKKESTEYDEEKDH
jgi:hypothetical protein